MGELVKRMGRRARRASAHAPLEFADPRSARRSPDEYLRIVSHHQDRLVGGFVEDARIDLSAVAPQVFSTLFRAVKQQTGVQIIYRSMSSPAGSERIIFPHAFVRAPRRWHVRAWCAQRLSYRDFTLGRMASAELVDTPNMNPQDGDAEWLRMLELVVVAHPALSIAQQEMIAHEYFPAPGPCACECANVLPRMPSRTCASHWTHLGRRRRTTNYWSAMRRSSPRCSAKREICHDRTSGPFASMQDARPVPFRCIPLAINRQCHHPSLRHSARHLWLPVCRQAARL